MNDSTSDPLRLSPIVEGNDSGDTVVFLQGWPDSASLWDGVVSRLRDRYRCVRFTLPNFAGDRTTRWGHRTPEILDALEALIEGAGRGKPVTLVLHDWGCYWGHAIHHKRPDLVARVASLDIAPHFKPTLRIVPPFIAYQWWLLGAFLVGGPVGDAMTRGFARLSRAPAPPSQLTAWMNYPYRNFWEDLVTGRVRALGADYWPTCPLLFVYGEDKPFPFHNRAWTDHVRKVGGEVIGLRGGHWVPQNLEFPGILDRWLATTATGG